MAGIGQIVQWHEAGVVELGGAGAADFGGQLVEREALGAGDLLFTRADAWGNEHCAALGGIQQAGHWAAHEEQPMEMIGNHGTFQQLYFGMVSWNLPPAVGYGFAKRRKRNSFASKMSQQRTAAFHLEGDHVDAATGVVVAEAPPLHGMLDRMFHAGGIIADCEPWDKAA